MKKNVFERSLQCIQIISKHDLACISQTRNLNQMLLQMPKHPRSLVLLRARAASMKISMVAIRGQASPKALCCGSAGNCSFERVLEAG